MHGPRQTAAITGATQSGQAFEQGKVPRPMSSYLDRARELRALEDPHYNCAQAVFAPFAEQAGLSFEQSVAITQAFGGGMHMGSVCGAITGGLMALGVLGIADNQTVAAFNRRMKAQHDGLFTCADLLRVNAEVGGQKKAHCDAMVFEAVALVEELLAEHA